MLSKKRCVQTRVGACSYLSCFPDLSCKLASELSGDQCAPGVTVGWEAVRKIALGVGKPVQITGASGPNGRRGPTYAAYEQKSTLTVVGGAGRAGFYFLFYQDPNLLSEALNWGKKLHFPPRDCLTSLLRLTGTYTSSALMVIYMHPFSEPSTKL